MIFLGCNTCLTVVQVIGSEKEIENLIISHSMWSNGWPCVISGCSSKMERLPLKLINTLKQSERNGLTKILQLTPQECFRALCGYGLPDEIGCEPEVVTALLKSTKIIGLDIQTSPSGRAIIKRLDLDNNTSLHLAASPLGSTVFKITRSQKIESGDSGSLSEDTRHGELPIMDHCAPGTDNNTQMGNQMRNNEGDCSTATQIPESMAEVKSCNDSVQTEEFYIPDGEKQS